MEELDPPFVVSDLARAEVPAALWRKHRIGELAADDAAVLAQAFEADFVGANEERFTRMSVTPEVLDDAARLVAVHPLRACDAVQLASALAARRVLGPSLHFGAFDRSLRLAAAAEGLAMAPIEAESET